MINGAHVIIHTLDAEADRRSSSGKRSIPRTVDAGADCRLQASSRRDHRAPHRGPASQGPYLMCDDLDKTMDELAAQGATLTAVTEARWGRLTSLHLPGGAGPDELRHPRVTDLYYPAAGSGSRRPPTRRCFDPQ